MSEIKKINVGGTEYNLPEGGGASAHVEGDALVINNSGSGTGSGGGSGGSTVTSITLNLNPTDYPLPTTEGDYTIVIKNQDVITELNSIADDIANNIISPQACSILGSGTSSLGPDVVNSRYHLSGNVFTLYYTLSAVGGNNSTGGAKVFTLVFKTPGDNGLSEMICSEVSILLDIKPGSVSGVINFSNGLYIYSIIETLYSESVEDAKIHISFIRI